MRLLLLLLLLCSVTVERCIVATPFTRSSTSRLLLRPSVLRAWSVGE